MRLLLIVFALAAGVICVLRIYFREKQETRWFLVKEIVSRLALAYLSAFLFYYIAVYAPRMQDRRNVHEYISGRIQDVVGSRNGLIKLLQDESGISPDVNREEMIIQACKVLNPRKPIPLIIGALERRQGTVADAIYITKRRAQTAVDNVIPYISLMDSEEIRLLNRIKSSQFFFQMDEYIQDFSGIRNTDLGFMGKLLVDYDKAVSELESYHERVIKPMLKQK